MAIRQNFEDLFAWIGVTSIRFPAAYLVISLALLTFSVWQMQYLAINTSTEGLFQKDDPALLAYSDLKDEFGRDVQFIVAVSSDDIFSPEFIRQFSLLQELLSTQVPYVDEVNSLLNAHDIYGEGDELLVRDFFEVLPASDSAWAEKKKNALENPLYRNVYLSSDGKMANIYIRPVVSYASHAEGPEPHQEMLGAVQIHEMMVSIRQVIARFPALEQHIHIAGTPVLADELSSYLVSDMIRFVIMAVIIIAGVLFLLFRSWWGVVLPLLVVLSALASTFALMSITGQPIQSPTVILPSFILVAGISDAIHLLSSLVTRMRLGESKTEALVWALRHCGVPIFFTITTTAAGLFSFGGSDILPVANLGWFSAAGVFFAFVYTIILLPALIAVSPVRILPETKARKKTWIDQFIIFSHRFSHRHTVAILVTGAVIAILSVYGALQLEFSHDPVKWLPENSYGRQSIEQVSNRLGGTVAVEIIIDTGTIDGVKDAEFMRILDESVGYLEQYRTDKLSVGKVLSVTTLLKQTNQALLENSASAYAIPASRALIAQEFLMLEASGAEELFRRVDRNYQKAHITVLTTWADALYFDDFIHGMEITLNEKFSGKARIEITGAIPMLAKILKKIMQATAFSYAFSLVIITCMMIALLGSFRYGLISIIPNVLPITMVLGLMHVNNAPLDMFSMLIGAIAIGLAVDDTVHFMDGFRHAFKRTGDASMAITETFNVSGRAMLSTSTVLVLGFLIYTFSPMQNLKDFGLYTSLCIVLAALADFWLTPALLLLLHRKKPLSSPGGQDS